MDEQVESKGKVTAILKDPSGRVKKILVIENLILDDGKEIFADLIGGTGAQTHLQCIALGTDGTAPSATDTDLIGTELGYKATTNEHISPGKERFVATFLAGEGTGTIQEAILADTVAAKGARKCACRVAFGAITKAAGDTLTWIWDITFP